MELENLRAFVSVVDAGSFTAAAHTLHLAQPSVSSRIRRLEESLGERLLDRTTRRVRLTPSGRHLLPFAESVVRSAAGLAEAARDLRGLRSGTLLLGTTDLASIYVLPRAYRRFRRAHPEIDLSVTVEGTAPLLGALRERTIELAVVNLPVRGDDLDVSILDEEDLLLLLPPRHPLAARRRVRPEEIARIPMITFKKNSVTRREVERAFEARGVSPAVAMEISSPEAIKKLVQVGLGFALLPRRSVRAELREGRLAAPSLTGMPLRRKIGFVRLKGGYLSPAAEAFRAVACAGGEVRRRRHST